MKGGNMKKVVIITTALFAMLHAGTCHNVTVTDEHGHVHLILVCD